MLKSPWLETAAVLAVVVAALTYAAGPTVPSFGSMADWAAAIATTSAACTALWLGLAEGRRRAADRQENAAFVRSVCAAELHVISSSLCLYDQMADGVALTFHVPGHRDLNIAALRAMIKHLETPILDRAFLLINTLEKEDAENVSLIYAEVPRLRRALEAWVDQYDAMPDPEPLRVNTKARAADIRKLISLLSFVDYE